MEAAKANGYEAFNFRIGGILNRSIGITVTNICPPCCHTFNFLIYSLALDSQRHYVLCCPGIKPPPEFAPDKQKR